MAQQETAKPQKREERQPEQRHEDSFFNLLLIIQNIFKDLGVGLPPETASLTEDISEEQIIAHPVFQAAYPDFTPVQASISPQVSVSGQTSASDQLATPAAPSMSAGVIGPSSLFSNPTYSEAALRAAVSIGIERYAEDCLRRGVKYEFDAKAETANAVSCSGFVRNAVIQIEALRSGSSANMRTVFGTHSDGQISRVSEATNFMLRGDQVNLSNMKAGMIIGIDSGERGWDAGRTHGINHIGIVYADTETGKLTFAESKGGKGVTTTDLSTWLERAHQKGYDLFAADVVKLAGENYNNRSQSAPSLPELTSAGAGGSETLRVAREAPGASVAAPQV